MRTKINGVIFTVRRGGKGGERDDYLVRFSFTRFSVRMETVSCMYFMRGDTACKTCHINRYVTGTRTKGVGRKKSCSASPRHC